MKKLCIVIFFFSFFLSGIELIGQSVFEGILKDHHTQEALVNAHIILGHHFTRRRFSI